MKSNNLYFVAIVLPDDLQSEIVSIEQYIAEKYHSYRSLKIVPHITLKAPFTIEVKEHDIVLHWFSSLFLQISPFEVELRDFRCFPNSKSPVIYIHPLPNNTLHHLQLQVIHQFEINFVGIPIMHHEHQFKPHVTVAYRDLTLEQFVPAWQEFSLRTFSAVFTVSEIQLLQHDGLKWNTVAMHTLH